MTNTPIPAWASLLFAMLMYLLSFPTFCADSTSSLDVKIQGNGNTVVLFEAGFGTPRQVWDDIIARLPHDQFTIISYSRAGVGHARAQAAGQPLNQTQTQTKENSSQQQDSSIIAADITRLQRLIDQYGSDKPVILVGHSYGGLLVSEVARRQPDKVAGLLLIEPSTLQQRNAFLQLDGERVAQDDASLAKVLPATLYAAYEQITADMEATITALTPLPAAIPVILFTATAAHPQPFVIEETAAGKAVWLQLHNTLIKNSVQAIHYRLPVSEHNLHVVYPARIVDAVERLHDMIN